MASEYEVQVVPDASGWSAKLEAQVGGQMRAFAEQLRQRLAEAGSAFDGYGARLRASLDPAARSAGDNLRDQLQRGLRDGLNGTPGNNQRQGQQSGRQFADAFSREVKAKLEAAFRSLPDVPLSLNSSAADVEIAAIREKLKAAAKDLELGVDTGVVDARVEALQARLEALAKSTPDVRVRVNTTAALAQIEAFRAALKGEGDKAGGDFTDALNRQMRTKIQAAVESLPKIKLDANSTEVDRKLAEIRAHLEAADNAVKIGVDTRVVDARLDELRVKLARLSTTSADIRVRVNAGTALAELEALKRATRDDNQRGGLFTRLISDLRESSSLADTVVGKLGAVGNAVGSGPTGTIVMISAIVAALSTIGPLAAAASGALLGVAGVAGVAGLAVLGLKKQMAEQTGFGEQISTQVKSLMREVGGLAQIAADAVGPAIRDVLGFVRNAIPSFQGLVQLVGGRLGGAFREVAAGLVTMIQKASPLIFEVAGYIEDGAAAFHRWVLSDSFNNFLAYARKELPVIIGYVGDFAKAIVEFFVAFAPVGENVLKVLDLVAKTTAETAKLLGGAFHFSGGGLFGLFGSDDDKKKADSNASAIDNLINQTQAWLDGTTQLAGQTGPLDNYTKIIGDLVPKLQAGAVNGHAFADSVNGITDRLKSAAPPLAAFMDTASSYDPATAKLADTAKLLGDALTASRGYALDYAAAMVAADSATQSLAKTLHDNIASVAKDGTLLGVSHLDAAGKFVSGNAKYVDGSQQIVSAFQAQVKAATDAATSTFLNEKATKGQATAAADALTIYKGYRQQIIDSAGASEEARAKAKALADQYFAIPPDVATFIKLLGQDNVTLAIQGLTDALNRLSDFIGIPKVELNKTDFDNSSAIVNSKLDYFNQAVTTPKADLNNSQLTSKLAQAQRNVSALNDLQGRPTVSLVDHASSSLHQIQGQIYALRDKTVVITTIQRLVQQTATAKQADIAGARSAYGNIFPSVGHYAMGGIVDKLKASLPSFAYGSENHVPQIALPNGGVRIWAEPETQGEAYIPFAMDRRERAEDIVSQVAHRFGGAYVPNTAALTAAASSSSGGSSGGSSLLGVAVTIDAGSVGTLTGHITAVSDSRIARRESDVRLQKSGPPASPLS